MAVDPLSALFAELGRLAILHRLERELARRGYRLVAGVDEVGRGCLAGPVVAAAAILPPDCVLPGLDDSKRLDAESRERVERLVLGLSLPMCHSRTVRRSEHQPPHGAALRAVGRVAEKGLPFGPRHPRVLP